MPDMLLTLAGAESGTHTTQATSPALSRPAGDRLTVAGIFLPDSRRVALPRLKHSLDGLWGDLHSWALGPEALLIC